MNEHKRSEPRNPETPPQPDSPETLSRRQFFERLSLALGGATTLLLAIPLVGFVFAPLFRHKPRLWREVGAVDAFRIGETVDVRFEDASPLAWTGVTARNAAWLRRDGPNTFTAFSVNCTHLGCPVRWLAEAQLFMCPCHGGVYYRDGSVAAGPPPSPLSRYPVRLRGGRVEILPGPIPITQ